jgi:cell division protein FtsZ
MHCRWRTGDPLGVLGPRNQEARMSINLKIPDIRELKPRITVFGVGGAGGNAVNNMISAGLQGVDFVVANTDAQALTMSKAERIIQMGVQVTEGLGAGSQPDIGRAAAEEVIDEIRDHLNGAHMVFVTAGMGGGTGTGAAPIVAKAARDLGILTVGVVTKPFHFEGQRRMRFAEAGIADLAKVVDTLIIIPNQNLFRVANEKTTFADAFAMADQVLYSGVACITDLMVKEGLINLDFADVRVVMRGMGKAMMGTGEASGDKRALRAAEAAIANPLIDDVSMKGAKGLLISITGGNDLTLYEVDEAATRIREEVDLDANIIVGATFDEGLDGIIRVSVVATGVDQPPSPKSGSNETRLSELTTRLKDDTQRLAERLERPEPPQRGRGVPHGLATPLPNPQASVIDSTGTAAVASAVLPQTAESKPPEPPMPKAFVPPQPERAPNRAPRMPRIDEFPVPVQEEIRKTRGEAIGGEHPEKRRMTLLQRLASVGLGRREGDDEVDVRPAQRAQHRSASRPPDSRQDPVSEYAKRSGPAGLDPHGRQSAVNNPTEDDELDIPAFLRRQAN